MRKKKEKAKMNKTVLIGRLVKDSELRFTAGKGTANLTFTLAVDNYNTNTKEKGADYIPIVVWGKQAESLSQYLLKGALIAVSGKIQTRNYEAKDRTKRYVTEVVSDAFGGIQLLGGKKDNNSDYSAPIRDAFDGVDYQEDITPVDDDDSPF